MKKILCVILLPVALATALPSIQAEQSTKLRQPEDAPGSEAKSERRVFVRRNHEKPELESVAFLGVETAPVSPALTAQLGLAKNAGLVVRNVVPNSPAAGVLQMHDILLKLDDQLLIDSRQFAVLVRNHKEGDEVTLTYVRLGKQATAKVKLTTHEVPKMAFFGGPGFGDEHFGLSVAGPDEGRPPQKEEMTHVLSLLDRHRDAGSVRRAPFPERGNVGYRALSVNVANSNMVFTDDQGSLELTIKDGKKSLIAKNTKGDQLYSGPIDTPEQRKSLPEDVRVRLDKLEGMQEFSFEPDPKFHTDVRVFHGTPSQIALPLPPPEDLTESPPAAAF